MSKNSENYIYAFYLIRKSWKRYVNYAKVVFKDAVVKFNVLLYINYELYVSMQCM